ncbi:MAG: MarR family transcriptional regulator [Pseudomonadota bacterium]
MRKVDAEMNRIMPALDSAGIGSLGTITLHRLHRLAPAPIYALVEAMGRDPSQVSRVIRRLEGRGLVSKMPLTEDKRVNVLSLTPAGKKHVEVVETALRGVIGEVFAPLVEAERTELLSLLKKLSGE